AVPPQPDRARLLGVRAVDDPRELVARLTAFWRSGRLEELVPLLHDDVVFVHPGFGGRTVGAAACADTYRDFLARARITAYQESDVSVDAVGDGAVATYRFDMEWEMDGAVHRESGHDILVLVRTGARWAIAWRTLVSSG